MERVRLSHTSHVSKGPLLGFAASSYTAFTMSIVIKQPIVIIKKYIFSPFKRIISSVSSVVKYLIYKDIIIKIILLHEHN